MMPSNGVTFQSFPGSHTPPSAVFSSFDEKYLVELYKICQVKSYQKDDTIIDNSKHISSLYFILKGSVTVSISSSLFTYNSKISHGQFFGFIPHDNAQNTSYSLISNEMTTLFEINYRIFKEFPDDFKIEILKSTNTFLSNSFVQLMQKSSYLTSIKNHLISYIQSLDQKKQEIVSSNLIQDVLKKIPRLPTYTNDILTKLLNDNISTQEIVNSIQSDPSLAGIILKAVNSSYYGLSGKISDIYHAVVYLGFNNVYQLILEKTIQKIMPDDPEFHEIQKKSSMIAIISHEIASISDITSPLTVTTIGLLHEIGTIVTTLLKRKYQNIRELLENLDNAIVGASLLQTWGLPEKIINVIKCQNFPEYSPIECINEEYRKEIAILHLSKICYQHIMNERSIKTIFVNEYFELLGIRGSSEVQFCNEVVIPALLKNKKRYPDKIRNILKSRLEPEST